LITYAEFPKRKCRQPVQSQDGLIDHFCDLPEMHPGPDCPSTLPWAIARREAWEKANPGWEKMAADDDPFAGIEIPEEKR